MPSDVADCVSLLSFSKSLLLRGVKDRAGSTAAFESFRRRLSEPSSSGSRLRFRRVECRGSVRFADAVEACWAGSRGMDLTVGVSSEGTARAWAALVEDRVALLEGVVLATDVLRERPARAREVLLEGVAFVLFWTPADCFL